MSGETKRLGLTPPLSRRIEMLKFSLRRTPRAFRHWVGKEIGFTALPVVVVLFLVLYFKKPLDSFWLAPEWSFAAVVLLGSAIDQLSELREEGVFLPYKLHFMSKILLFLLILSVVTFALASSLSRFGSNISVNISFLLWSQISLFVIAVWVSLALEIATICADEERERFPQWMSSYRFYKHLKLSLDATKKNLRYAGIAFQQRRRGGAPPTDPIMQSAIWLEMKKKEIEAELQCIELLLMRAKEEFSLLQETDDQPENGLDNDDG